MLHGRSAECAQVDRLLDRAREHRSSVLVLRGEPGIGKSALLQEAVARASEFRVLRGSGVQSEAELPFAGLHQLLHPVLDHAGALPSVQRVALESAFGLVDDIVRNRFLVSLGVLSLLAEVAEAGPLLCAVDDAQWLDAASADAITFAARRIEAEGIVILLAAREGEPRQFVAPGLPQLRLRGLDADASRLLLQDVVPGIAPQVGAALVNGTAGNPLGLREISRSLSPEQLIGAEPLSDPLPASTTVESVFLARVREQSEAVQSLLLVVAASHVDQMGVISRAARVLGLDPASLDAAERAGLIRADADAVSFEHPLIRSAVYQGATRAQRHAVHRALASTLRADGYPDAAVWHLAAATTEPDEGVAASLERSAARTQRRGGHAAAADAYRHAAALSPDAGDRARRLIAAGWAAWRAGQPEQARELLSRADGRTTDQQVAAEGAQLRGTLEFRCGSPRQAYEMLMAGAQPVVDRDPGLAARMYSEAAQIAWTSGDRDDLAEASRQVQALPGLNDAESVLALITRAIDAYLSEDYRTSTLLFRQAVDRGQATADPRVSPLVAGALVLVGDDAEALRQMERAARVARSGGAVELLPTTLALLASSELDVGRYSAASATANEGLKLAVDTGQDIIGKRLHSVLAWTAAVQGRPGDCHDQAARATAETGGTRRWPPATAFTTWALAMDDLGSARYVEASSTLESLVDEGPDLGHHVVRIGSAADLVEAAVRVGREKSAQLALQRLEAWALPTQAPWGRALVSRCLALLSDEAGAEEHFVEALRNHDRASRRFDTARTALLFGEWLRRRRRRLEARDQLRRACDDLERMGATPWAERARSELRATGETARKRDPSTVSQLTPQELQVARAVGQGATNRDVAAQLFLSPRTVDYHLHKVFTKLGVASRKELIVLTAQDEVWEPAAAAVR